MLNPRENCDAIQTPTSLRLFHEVNATEICHMAVLVGVFVQAWQASPPGCNNSSSAYTETQGGRTRNSNRADWPCCWAASLIFTEPDVSTGNSRGSRTPPALSRRSAHLFLTGRLLNSAYGVASTAANAARRWR